MDLLNLLKNAKVDRIATASSVATTVAVNSSVLDMANYNGVTFLFGGFATSGAGHLMKAQKVATTTGGTPVDLSGASVTNLNGFGPCMLNVAKPRDRYIRVSLQKGTVGTATGDVFAIRYNGRRRGDALNTTSDADNGVEIVSAVSPST